jgi:uncharacterized membrane protein YgaE (UPF0421/DUF939 family)
MGQRKKIAIEATTEDRCAWLQEELDTLNGYRRHAERAAKNTPSAWASVAALSRQIAAIRAEYDEHLLQHAEPEINPADLPPEEYRQWLAEHAQALSVPDLEVYVQTWASKVGAMVVMENGRAQLRHRSAS